MDSQRGMNMKKIILIIGTLLALTGCSKDKSHSDDNDITTPVSANSGEQITIEATTEKSSEKATDEASKEHDDIIRVRQYIQFDYSSGKLVQNGNFVAEKIYDDHRGNIISKTGGCSLLKKTDYQSEEYIYDVSANDTIIWEDLDINKLVSDETGDSVIYVCDAYCDDKTLDILVFAENNERKYFLVCSFDRTAGEFVSNRKYDLLFVDDAKYPMVDDITSPMITENDIYYSSIDQTLFSVDRSSGEVTDLSGFGSTLFETANENSEYEAMGWFRPVAYYNGYIFFYANMIPDKDFPEGGSTAVAVFNEDGKLLDHKINGK
jgi:hypothetical protein